MFCELRFGKFLIIKKNKCDIFLKKKTFHGLFLWIRFNCLKAEEPLRGDRLLLTTSPERVPQTELINFKKMKN